ncbi:TPA: hypothetical protein QCU60_005078 [Bacillus cereus]|nr:hypothetical protein [Bacillus cereus]
MENLSELTKEQKEEIVKEAIIAMMNQGISMDDSFDLAKELIELTKQGRSEEWPDVVEAAIHKVNSEGNGAL